MLVEVCARFCRRAVVSCRYACGLVAPEYGVEGEVPLVGVVILVVGDEVVYCWVSHGLVAHEVAVECAVLCRPCRRHHSGKALPRLGIDDDFVARHRDGEVAAHGLVVLEQAVGRAAERVGGYAAAGGPRYVLRVKFVDRTERIVFDELRVEDVDVAVGVDGTSVARGVLEELAIVHYERYVVRRWVGYVGYEGVVGVVERLGPVAVNENAAASEVGLLHIFVPFGILSIEGVGIATSDCYSVEYYRAGVFALGALKVGLAVVSGVNGVRELVRGGVVLLILEWQRAQFSGVGIARHNVIDVDVDVVAVLR